MIQVMEKESEAEVVEALLLERNPEGSSKKDRVSTGVGVLCDVKFIKQMVTSLWLPF